MVVECLFDECSVFAHCFYRVFDGPFGFDAGFVVEEVLVDFDALFDFV